MSSRYSVSISCRGRLASAAAGVRLLVVASLLLACGTAGAVAQSLDWVKQGGGLDLEQARGVGVDAAGNTYVTGIFSSVPATFGAGSPNETILTSVDGTQDLFVAKYNSSGVLQWAKAAGTGGADDAYGIAVDSEGNSYVTGNMGGAFVLKYDTNGNVVWTTSLNSSGIGFAIDVGPDGSSVAAGYAADPLLGGSIVTVWRVGPEGNLLWEKQATGLYLGGGGGVSIDSGGNSYVAGLFFAGFATFGAGEPNETTLSDVDGAGNEMFVAKYDAAGNLLWARQSPDVPGSSNYAQAISTDGDGNSYVAGTGSAFLSGLEPALHSAYIAKYDT
jgi:Beta-propeller repeat